MYDNNNKVTTGLLLFTIVKTEPNDDKHLCNIKDKTIKYLVKLNNKISKIQKS